MAAVDINNATEPATINMINPSSINLLYLVSDMIQWNSTEQRFHNYLAFDIPKRGAPLRLYRQLQQTHNDILWSQDFTQFVPLHREAYISPPPPVTTTVAPFLKSTEWVPDYNHWTLHAKAVKPLPIHKVPIGEFRFFMQIQHRRKQNKFLLVSTSGSIPIPFAIPNNYLPPKIWKFFWSLPLPHRIVTVW